MARMKVGSLVTLPDGSTGVIYTMGGQVGTRAEASMVGPDGKPESKPEVQEGSAICHILDENGETVMEKHPTQMRFVTKEITVALAELAQVSEDQIPKSRRRRESE